MVLLLHMCSTAPFPLDSMLSTFVAYIQTFNISSRLLFVIAYYKVSPNHLPPSCDCGQRQNMNEQHCRHVPINTIWRQTESTPQSRRWCCHMAGIYSDCSTREIMIIICWNTQNVKLSIGLALVKQQHWTLPSGSWTSLKRRFWLGQSGRVLCCLVSAVSTMSASSTTFCTTAQLHQSINQSIMHF